MDRVAVTLYKGRPEIRAGIDSWPIHEAVNITDDTSRD
jgi:hypothetical protein